ncbi:hypothetical protein AKJ16_DCAP10773 [Drosera capensis]
MSVYPWRVEVGGATTKKRKLMMMSKDEEDRDAKVEKLFALIKNVRDLRGSFCTDGRQERERNTNEDEKIAPTALVWKPSFKVEYFVREAITAKDPSKEAGASTMRNQEEQSGKRGNQYDNLKHQLTSKFMNSDSHSPKKHPKDNNNSLSVM